MLLLGAFSAEAQQHYDRGYEAFPSSPFIKKGTWVAGGTLRYSQHVNDGHKILVIDDINSKGYNISVNPKLLYMLKDNMGVGLKFSYDRGMLDLASADLAISDISMGAKDCYQINHKYSAYALCRAYVPFGNIKRFSLFADVMLGGSFKQGKAFNAGAEYVLGAYEKAFSSVVITVRVTGTRASVTSSAEAFTGKQISSAMDKTKAAPFTIFFFIH